MLKTVKRLTRCWEGPWISFGEMKNKAISQDHIDPGTAQTTSTEQQTPGPQSAIFHPTKLDSFPYMLFPNSHTQI
jgi:hypothetical protein